VGGRISKLSLAAWRLNCQTYFRTLCKSVTDGQLGHVVPLLAQGNEVVVNASLVLASIVEIELLGLDVVFAQFLLFEL
jgi:hypothetical protein